jgi:intein/homing endonuclease
MDTVVNDTNINTFISNKINVVVPRKANVSEGYYSTNKNVFYSYSLADFRTVFLEGTYIPEGKFYILLDVANGHMPAVRDSIVAAKIKYGNRIVIMAGNVANPNTYRILSESGADYVRVGIGNGCFIDGSIITTINGKKPIEDVINGDLVLTHNCNYKEVVNTKRFEYTGELIKINDQITCTPDHKFYVISKKYLDTVTDDNIHTLSEWVSAMELYNNPDYYVLIETDDYEKKDTV